MKAACKKELKKAAEHLCDSYDTLTAAIRAEPKKETQNTIAEARNDVEAALRLVRVLTGDGHSR